MAEKRPHHDDPPSLAVRNPYSRRSGRHLNNSSDDHITTATTTATTNVTNDSDVLLQRSISSGATFSQVFDDVEELPLPPTAPTAPATQHGSLLRSNDNNYIAASTINPASTTTLNHKDMIQPHVLHVSLKQRGNGVLRYIRNVPYQHIKIAPDFEMAPNRCCLFLSMKYHNLHPNYIFRRISELGSNYDLRVLLCLVDMEDNASTLLFLNKICVTNSLSLVLAWSEKEAARYLETFKAYEGKDATALHKKKEETFAEQVADCLQTVRSVNKTDSAALISQFTNLKSIVTAPIEELTLCPGIGDKKVRRLYDAFHKPFHQTKALTREYSASTSENNIIDVESQKNDGGVTPNTK